MMSNILGFGKNNLLGRGVQSLTDALSSNPSNVPPGLCNISNSCYQNSVIQGLASLPVLREYLHSVIDAPVDPGAETTGHALYEMLKRLNDPANNGHNYWVSGKLKSMSTFSQQDAQEYFSKILDELDKEAQRNSSRHREKLASWLSAARSLNETPVATQGDVKVTDDEPLNSPVSRSPLDGLIAQRVGCTACGYSEGLSLITFNCLTVSLGKFNSYDIRDCLDEYTKLEYIDGVECAKCTLLKIRKTLQPLASAQPGSAFEARLKSVTEVIENDDLDDNTLTKTLNIAKKNWVQSSKSKQIVIARAPRALVLHVNRSIFDETTGAQYKNTAHISYPAVLNLGDWCLGQGVQGKDSSGSAAATEIWPRDPNQSMLSRNSVDSENDTPLQYRLRAAVTHFGSHSNGHYICYRPHARTTASDIAGEASKEEGDEQWWRFSDDTVYAVPEEQAHQGNIFMLFYERIDEFAAVSQRAPDAVSSTIDVTEDVPLPPSITSTADNSIVDEAITVALPKDDEDPLDSLAPSLAQPLPSPRDIETLLPDAPTSEVVSISSTTTTAVDLPTTLSATDPSTPTTLAQPTKPEPQHSNQHQDQHPTSNATTPLPPPTPASASASASTPSTRSAPSPISLPPHLMRTAGTSVVRRQGSRQSMMLVPAT